MKERPIIFSGEMVRAILDGRKTQTRRVINSTALPYVETIMDIGRFSPKTFDSLINSPFGKSGDRLWVRETFAYKTLPEVPNSDVIYKANFDTKDGFGSEIIDFNTGELTPLIWKPSIFMPRWASRITLEIVNVRVERLQEITINSLIAEGVLPDESCLGSNNRYRHSFEDLWNSLNAKRGYSWDVNPWVWVLEFKRI